MMAQPRTSGGQSVCDADGTRTKRGTSNQTWSARGYK